MQIVKRNPDNFWSLPSLYSSWLDEFWGDGLRTCCTQSTAALNVREEDKVYVLSLAMPGMARKDFNIEVEDDVLTIRCEKKETKEEKTNGFLHQEFNYMNGSRSVRLPKGNIDAGKIKARYEQGILHVELPKKEQTRQVQKITID